MLELASPRVVRYYLGQAHYRSILDYRPTSLQEAAGDVPLEVACVVGCAELEIDAAARRLSTLRGLFPFLRPYQGRIALAFVLLLIGAVAWVARRYLNTGTIGTATKRRLGVVVQQQYQRERVQHQHAERPAGSVGRGDAVELHLDADLDPAAQSGYGARWQRGRDL